MDWEILRGNLTTATSQSISYDSSKGTPAALMGVVLSVTDTTEQAEDAAICRFSWDGTNQGSAFTFHEQLINGDTRRGSDSNAFYFDKNGGTNAMDGSLALDSANNEFDLTFSNAPASTYEYAILVLYGGDVEAAHVWFDGNSQTEAPGFKPKFLYFNGASTGSSKDTSTSNAAYNAGICGSDNDTTPTQACIRYGSRDNFDSAYAHFSDSAVLLNMFAAAPTESIGVDTLTSTGFDISVLTGTNEPGLYLAINCDNAVHVGIESASAATGTLEFTGTGFEPGLIMVGGAVMDAVDTTYVDTNGANFFEGMVDLQPGTPVYASWYMTYEDTVESRIKMDHSNLIRGKDWVASAGTANEFAATVSATGSNGFTINRSTADDVVQFWYLAIEAPSSSTNYTRTVTENLGFTDTSSRTAALTRSSTENLGGTDADSRTAALARGTTEDFGFTDTASRSTAQSRGATEDIGLTDSSSRATAQTRGTTEDFGFTDTSSGTVSSGPVDYPRTVSENFGFTDTSSRTAALGRSASEDMGATDAASRTAALGRSVTENLGGTDAESRTAALTRGSEEDFGFTDTSSRTLGGEANYDRSSLENMGMTDSASRTVSYQTPPITGYWYDTDYGNLASSAEVSYYGVGLFGGKLAMSFTPDGSNAHTHFIASSEDAYAWTDYEITGSLQRTALTGIGVTVFSDYPNSDTYYRLRTYQSSNQWYITKHPDGQLTDVPVVALSPTNQWVNYRIRVEAGTSATTIYAKLWVDGSTEPTGWQATAVDSDADRITSGTVGYWAFGTSGGTNYHADMRINLFDGNGFRGVPVEGQGAVGTIGVFVGTKDIPASSNTTLQALSFGVQGTTNVTGVANWRNSNSGVLTIAPGSGLLFTGVTAGYSTIQAEYQGSVSEPLLIRAGGGNSQTVTVGDFTWEIAEANLTTGTFLGGDPYVVAPGAGPISVIGYTPAPTQVGGRNVNGSMVNPSSSSFLLAKQGYSARDGQLDDYPLSGFYDIALDAGRPNGGALSWSNPLFLYRDSSHVVSMDMGFPAEKSVIDDYGILTVLSAAPASPSTTFRPQLYAGTKTLYTTADYSMAVLPEWDATAAATTTPPSFADVEALFAGTHVHAVSHWADRYYRSMTAGPPQMRSRALHWSRAILRLCCGANTSQKSGLLNKFLQLCIDQDGARAAGFVWEPSGGQMFGSKMLCYFKAKLFGETIPTDGSHWSTNSGGYYFDEQVLGPRPFPQFQEDAQTFIVGVEHNKKPGWIGYAQYNYGPNQYTMPEFGGNDISYGGSYWASPPDGVLSGHAWNADDLIYTLPESLPGVGNIFRVNSNFACLHGHYLFMWHIINSAQGTLEELRWRVD